MEQGDLSQQAARWFGSVEIADAPQPSLDVLAEMVEMLDHVQPALLDRDRSSVRRPDRGWPESRGLQIRLVHTTNAEGAIVVDVGQTEGVVSWLAAHEHVDQDDGGPDRPWTNVVIDATAAVLRGQYEIENHYRGRRLVKTKVVDVADQPPRLISATATILALLPWPGRSRVERARLDFGVRGLGFSVRSTSG